jgi:drug/metabolite transporter (DMT)-like permease
VTSLAFAKAGARVGSLSVNLIRLFIALPLLSLWTFVASGSLYPSEASSEAWAWLSLSGLVGFVIGDMCLFRAFVVMGPRLSSLIMATAPLITAVIGFFVLGETLGTFALLGMGLTIAGVSWALADRKASQSADRRRLALGVLLAFGGALGQAGGLVLSKYGMGDYDAFASTQIRVIASCGAWLLIFALTNRWSYLFAALRNASAMRFTALGALFGPVLGVGLSLYAVQHANTGVAASIMSITPILLIPITVVFYRERVGVGSVLGTCVAVAGVVVLFLA